MARVRKNYGNESKYLHIIVVIAQWTFDISPLSDLAMLLAVEQKF
jgi:hypothetical protein